MRCIETRDTKKVLSKIYDGMNGGNYGGVTITHEILRAGYYWPNLFKDSHSYVKKFHQFQNSVRRKNKFSFPLQPMIIECPFQQWGLDIIGEVNPNSPQLHKYILTTTNYFTRCRESIPLNTINEIQVTSFLESHIITICGILESLTFDNAKYFSSLKLIEFALE